MPDEDMILEAMIKEAQAAPEPGELKRAQVLKDGKEADTAPMIAKELTSAGYVWIYDTRTGDRSKCNRNMLMQHLKKTRPDGSTVFTLHDPHIEVKAGKMKCLLHPDNPNRAKYDDMGLATCLKSNIPSEFLVTRHMKKRHKMEWEQIEHDRAEAEKQEDRAERRHLMAMMARNAPKVEEVMEIKEPERELYVSDKDKAKLKSK